MAQPFELSDDLLDAISGGVFTYQGETTQIHRINQQGIEAETAEGRMFFPWSYKAFQDFSTAGHIDEIETMVAALVQGREFRLEEYARKPCPVND